MYLWRGEADTLAPTALARYLAQHIANCEAVFYPNEDHGTPIIKHTEAVLRKALPH